LSTPLRPLDSSNLARKQIAINGKKQRGAAPKSRGNRGPYLLNAWVSESRFCLAQSRVEDKSNEITAIPQVLSDIDIEDAVVSIDAMAMRYYISDEGSRDAAYFGGLVRGHCSIENQQYWHLDITFREDACRAWAGHSSQNLSILRKMALHIISRQTDKLSFKKRLYKAALDIEYLKKLLGILMRVPCINVRANARKLLSKYNLLVM
jgi:predicted transposase YbfD/YdcC